MSLLRSCRQTAAEVALRWRAGKNFFDSLELSGMQLFAKLLHGFIAGPPGIPAEGPVIVVANHPSHADALFLITACRRPLHFFQARECYAIPLVWRIFARAGAIPVSRGAPDRSALKLALERLAAGHAIGLFPEGEVSPPDGSMRPWRHGAAWLALKSGAPVVPVWIEGGPRDRGPAATWFIPSSPPRLFFGPPIDLSDFAGQGCSHAVLHQATMRMTDCLAALRPEPALCPTAAPRVATS
jgi:1-acyl-sn-glycerol-3-phosphate acyltransferase